MDDLAAVLERLLGAAVSNLVRLSGGASRETWSFDAAGRGLIMQRQRAGGGTLSDGMATEASLLRAAAAAGVPVAPLVASGDGADDGMGAPWIVVERMAGETIARKLLRDDEFAAARAVMAGQCGRALAGVHSIALDAVPGLTEPDQLTQFADLLSAFDQPRPALELGLRRLAATRPRSATTRRTVVHGDFRTGNLLVGPDGLRAVLDWELAHIGDPIEDLGWFCVRAWRFGSPARAGGFGTVDELVAGYEEAGGAAVDRDALQWWEAMGTLKWGVMCMIQAASHLTGATRSVELATIGRRVCENEWDLLQRWMDLGSIAPTSVQSSGGGALFGRPTASELVEATREFLTGDVMAQTEGRLRFHARVAGNALAMVERELALGPDMVAAHEERLAKLGFEDDAELAAAIRRGDCDDRWDEVAASVALDVRDQLLVANPKHLDIG